MMVKDSFPLSFNELGRLELTLQTHKQIGPKSMVLSSQILKWVSNDGKIWKL